MFIHAPIIGIPTIKTQGIPIAEDARLAYMENLSDRIISALTEIGKNQSELARFVGVRSPSVNDWISGKTKTIKGQNLLRAAEFLKVSPLWLAEGKGPKSAASLKTVMGAIAETSAREVGDAKGSEAQEGRTINALVTANQTLIAGASEEVNKTIFALLTRYDGNKEQGEEIAKAIKVLLGLKEN